MGLLRDYDTQLQVGGLFAQVEVTGELPPFAEVALVLLIDGAEPINVRTRLTVATPGSVCVELLPEAQGPLATAIAQLLQGEAPSGSAERRGVRLLTDEPARPVRVVHSGPMPLDRKIAAMSTSEKVQLALHGEREARSLLCRERAGVIQASVVRNPKVSLDEVTALARSPQLAPDAAEMIANHVTFGVSSQIALALVRNPRTPIPVAVEMVKKLQPNDLRAVAKGLGVRAQITQAARKILFE